MSVIFDANTEGLERLSNLVPNTQDMTVMFYMRKIASPAGPPDFNTQWYWGDDPQVDYTDYVFIGYNPSAELKLDIGGPDLITGSYTLPDNGLYHITYVRSGNNHKLYVNGVVQINLTSDIVTGFATPIEQYLGTDTFTVDTDDQEIAYYREWNTALIESEVVAEMNSPNFAVVRTSALFVDTPLVSDILDDSGNGFDWSLFGGAITFTSGILNQDENNARPILELVTYTQAAFSGATTFDLHYRYMVPGPTVQRMASMHHYGTTDLTTYIPVCLIQTGVLGSLVSLLAFTSVASGEAMEVPLDTLATNAFVYFRFRQISGNPNPSPLTISFSGALISSIPVGSIAVPDDDGSEFGMFFFDRTTGEAINVIIPFPHGESGDGLQPGVYAVEDRSNFTVKTFDSQFDSIASAAFPGSGKVVVSANHTQDQFYVANNVAPLVLRTVSKAGTLGAVIANISGTSIQAMAVSPDGTKLYYSRGVADSTVRLWNITGDTDGGVFATGLVSSKLVFDILVLTDGTILASYEVFGVTPWFVEHYTSAGVLIKQFTLPQDTFFGADPRLAYALDNPDSFWVWTHEGGDSRWININTLTGVFNIDVGVGVTGEFRQNKAEVATINPTSLYGPSISCPFFITRGPNGAGGPPPGTSVIIPPGNTDGTILASANQATTGGLYQVVPNPTSKKLNDTLWVSFPSTITNVKKPNPTAQSGDIGE